VVVRRFSSPQNSEKDTAHEIPILLPILPRFFLSPGLFEILCRISCHWWWDRRQRWLQCGRADEHCMPSGYGHAYDFAAPYAGDRRAGTAAAPAAAASSSLPPCQPAVMRAAHTRVLRCRHALAHVRRATPRCHAVRAMSMLAAARLPPAADKATEGGNSERTRRRSRRSRIPRYPDRRTRRERTRSV